MVRARPAGTAGPVTGFWSACAFSAERKTGSHKPHLEKISAFQFILKNNSLFFFCNRISGKRRSVLVEEGLLEGSRLSSGM